MNIFRTIPSGLPPEWRFLLEVIGAKAPTDGEVLIDLPAVKVEINGWYVALGPVKAANLSAVPKVGEGGAE